MAKYLKVYKDGMVAEIDDSISALLPGHCVVVGRNSPNYDPFPMPPKHEHVWYYEGTLELSDREPAPYPLELMCKLCPAFAWFNVEKRT